MGNQPSSEAYLESPRPALSPPPDRPLPPLPRAATQPHKLSKPRTATRTRSRSRSTAGLLRSSDAVVPDKAAGGKRFSLTSAFSPKTPSWPSFATSSRSNNNNKHDGAGAADGNDVDDVHGQPHPSSPAVHSPSVFTFEEAVVSVTGQRDPSAWRPVSAVYPSPSLDLELLQEQQSRQLEFQQRRRRTLQQHHQMQLQRGSGFEPERALRDRESREKQQQPLPQKLGRARSFFRSRSSRRHGRRHDGNDDHTVDDDDADDGVDGEHRRRNSLASAAYPYTGDRPVWDDDGSQVPSPGRLVPASPRASWNYDMNSYAAKRLLHLVDDAPLDYSRQAHERASVASDHSRSSVLSSVTWKSSHPVRPPSPALTRANSDLSLYAPIRRTSIIQVPGVATRKNSMNDHFSGVDASTGGVGSRPVFRHSHPASTPTLSRQGSWTSTVNHVLSDEPSSDLRSPTLLPVLQRTRGSEPIARVSTPVEGQYNAIGAFKLGSLRITNGAASPMSSPEGAKRRKRETTNCASKDEDKGKSIRSPLFEQAAAPPTVLTSPALSPDASGMRAESEAGADLPDGKDSPALEPPEPLFSPSQLPQIELPGDLFAGFEFSFLSSEDIARPEEALPTPPPASPLSPPLPSPMALQTTSKATAMDDQLFEDDDCNSTSGFAGVEVLDVRQDPSAKPPPPTKSTMGKIRITTSGGAGSGNVGATARGSAGSSRHGVGRSDSGIVSTPTSDSSHKPLSKADSGYSSNVSLRSFNQTTTTARLTSSPASQPASSPAAGSFDLAAVSMPMPRPRPKAPIKRKPVPAPLSPAQPPPSSPPACQEVVSPMSSGTGPTEPMSGSADRPQNDAADCKDSPGLDARSSRQLDSPSFFSSFPAKEASLPRPGSLQTAAASRGSRLSSVFDMTDGVAENKSTATGEGGLQLREGDNLDGEKKRLSPPHEADRHANAPDRRQTFTPASSTAVHRTRSLTARLERSLSVGVDLARIASPVAPRDGLRSPTIPLVSAFSAAAGSVGGGAHWHPRLSSPLFTEAVAQQREAIAFDPPPLRHARPRPNWEVQTDHDSSGLSARHRQRSLDGQRSPSHGYATDRERRDAGPRTHRRYHSGDETHLAFLAASANDEGGFDDQPRVVRHRSSYDSVRGGPYGGRYHGRGGYSGYGPVPTSRYNYSAVALPAGGDGGTVHHGRSYAHRDACYEQPPLEHLPAGPPGPPHAQYRVLHSYNSPAYRGVPIWG